MKLNRVVTGILAALTVAACGGGNSERAMDVKQARAERDRAQQTADEYQREAEVAKNEMQQAQQAQREAEDRAREASQRAGVAEMQNADRMQGTQPMGQGIRQETTNAHAGKNATHGSVMFEAKSADLSMEGKTKVDDMLKDLGTEKVGSCHFAVTGFADDVGTEAGDKKLSEQRAAEVAHYLESKGVPSDHVTTVGAGAGKEKAQGGNKQGAGKAHMHRVDFVATTPANKK